MLDVEASLRALRESPKSGVDPDKVILFGRSLGGAVALAGADRYPGLVRTGGEGRGEGWYSWVCVLLLALGLTRLIESVGPLTAHAGIAIENRAAAPLVRTPKSTFPSYDTCVVYIVRSTTCPTDRGGGRYGCGSVKCFEYMQAAG